ncbi:MAG: 16S rRNA (guanine(966)-N(2))-methyltransferase RsmD [Alphaproteobacteria bacterium]|nr:16S rRNA (guanine(966)-N(2))-methyltransferase RsmD [Alphaproteobacteria bacterium]
MRIVGGRLKGRALATPKDERVRPTSDRVREAVFNILDHGIEDFAVTGAHVLDLFAGTGALGVEALSRGAAQCVFVENTAASRALIQENISTLGLGGVATIFRRSALDLGAASRRASFNLVFADPPYGAGHGEAAIRSAVDGGWLADGAVIVLEESAAAEINWPAGCQEIDRRRYGQTQITIGRYRAGGTLI